MEMFSDQLETTFRNTSEIVIGPVGYYVKQS